MEAVPSVRCLRHMRRVLLSVPASSRSRPQQWHPLLHTARKHLHSTRPLLGIKTHNLSDIGEGVKEVQIIQWFVEEGAKIEEWGALCEVQSDKASTEITSKYTGVVKKIHFQRDDVVQVGDAMVDIEVEEEGEGEGEENETSVVEGEEERMTEEQKDEESKQAEPPAPPASTKAQKGKHANLATPAVRGLLKEHGLSIQDIDGTGRDGRVLKEDIFNHLKPRDSTASTPPPTLSPTPLHLDSKQTETAQKLTPIQAAMFKTMTASLNIPHFLYTDTVNVTDLSATRKQLNTKRSQTKTADSAYTKLSYLPFIIKAVSLALAKYPLLNARLDLGGSSPGQVQPQLQLRSNHNIGVAMDTPAGLLVPVIKSVNARSITSIAQELARLSALGQAGKLGSADLSGGTITVSNIGNIGGEVVAPVIVEGQLAIMAVGKVKTVPVFGPDGQVQRAEVVNMSWSADHRVVDGATMARMATLVKDYLEEPASMLVDMV